MEVKMSLQICAVAVGLALASSAGAQSRGAAGGATGSTMGGTVNTVPSGVGGTVNTVPSGVGSTPNPAPSGAVIQQGTNSQGGIVNVPPGATVISPNAGSSPPAPGATVLSPNQTATIPPGAIATPQGLITPLPDETQTNLNAVPSGVIQSPSTGLPPGTRQGLIGIPAQDSRNTR